MPTYVYRFADTGETIEVQQSFDEPTLTEVAHPDDGRPRPVKKVFTPVGITFKGNGFYKTDSRGSKNGATSSSGSKSTDSSSSSVELVLVRLLGDVELGRVVLVDQHARRRRPAAAPGPARARAPSTGAGGHSH